MLSLGRRILLLRVSASVFKNFRFIPKYLRLLEGVAFRVCMREVSMYPVRSCGVKPKSNKEWFIRFLPEIRDEVDSKPGYSREVRRPQQFSIVCIKTLSSRGQRYPCHTIFKVGVVPPSIHFSGYIFGLVFYAARGEFAHDQNRWMHQAEANPRNQLSTRER